MKRCPLCGRPNRCSVAEGGARCWCFDLPVPPELLARVPQDTGRSVCICRDCIVAFNESVSPKTGS